MNQSLTFIYMNHSRTSQTRSNSLVYDKMHKISLPKHGHELCIYMATKENYKTNHFVCAAVT